MKSNHFSSFCSLEVRNGAIYGVDKFTLVETALNATKTGKYFLKGSTWQVNKGNWSRTEIIGKGVPPVKTMTQDVFKASFHTQGSLEAANGETEKDSNTRMTKNNGNQDRTGRPLCSHPYCHTC